MIRKDEGFRVYAQIMEEVLAADTPAYVIITNSHKGVTINVSPDNRLQDRSEAERYHTGMIRSNSTGPVYDPLRGPPPMTLPAFKEHTGVTYTLSLKPLVEIPQCPVLQVSPPDQRTQPSFGILVSLPCPKYDFYVIQTLRTPAQPGSPGTDSNTALVIDKRKEGKRVPSLAIPTSNCIFEGSTIQQRVKRIKKGFFVTPIIDPSSTNVFAAKISPSVVICKDITATLTITNNEIATPSLNWIGDSFASLKTKKKVLFREVHKW